MIDCRAMVMAVLVSAVPLSWASAEDPPLKPGRDPGGTAVAVLADGFDYRDADLNALLARDGEGEAIAFDAVDGDGRPFRERARGTDAVREAAALGGVRVVPIRVDAGNQASIAKGIGFAASTPARIVAADFSRDEHAALDVFTAAASRFADVLFVVSFAGLNRDKADPSGQSGTPTNLVVLSAMDHVANATQAVALAIGCGRGDLGPGGGEARARVFRERSNAHRKADGGRCEAEDKGAEKNAK